MGPIGSMSQPTSFGAPFGSGQGAATMGFGSSAVGGGMGMGGGAQINRWVPDAGEERYVTGMGARGSISSLSWFANGFLALTTWDGEIQVLEINQQGRQVQAKQNTAATMAAAGQQPPPILCSVCQGVSVAVGMADNKLREWNVQGGSTAVRELGSHDALIKRVMFLDTSWPTQGYLTGAFDQSVRLWGNQGSMSPAAKIALDFKVLALDGIAPYLLIAGSDRKVALYDLRKPTSPLYQAHSPLQV